MNIDIFEQNPIYPGALRFCDLHNGVTYQAINAELGLLEKGIFCGEPFISNEDYKEKLKIKAIRSIPANVNSEKNKQIVEIYLSGVGITRNVYGMWSVTNFCIKNSDEDLKLYKKWLNDGGNAIFEMIANKMKLISFDIEDEEY